MNEASDAIELFPMLSGLFGGLALFLVGMDGMAKGMQAAMGERMKSILARLTGNRFLGAATGAVVTGVLNSSSVTTVLVVGFVTAGLMTLQQSIGVIMGANIGSTVTAQVIAFDVGRYALAMVAAGFFAGAVGKRDGVRQGGAMVMGLGMVFFGMSLMGDGMAPLRSYEPFIGFMERMERPLLGIAAGALFTGLVQSSAATVGIAIVMAGNGLVSLPSGIALALGANIGTCVTALLAAIGKPVEARRAAFAHIVFNLLGVALWLPFIDHLAGFAAMVSPSYGDLEGAARRAAEVPRQIANANTLFNVANTLIFIGLAGPLARVVTWLVRERPEARRVLVRPLFLDRELTRTPSLALDRVRLELGHMGEILEDMFAGLPSAFAQRRSETFHAIAAEDDKVDILADAIVRYLGDIRGVALSESESREFVKLMAATDHLESIGDVFEADIAKIGHLLTAHELTASEAMRALLRDVHGRVGQALHEAITAIRENDEQAAHRVTALKPDINRLIQEAVHHQADRFRPGDEQRAMIFRAEMAALEALKRIYTLSKRIAKLVLPEAADAGQLPGGAGAPDA